MGYSFSLDNTININCSDKASNALWLVIDAILFKLKDIEGKGYDDCFNTPSILNVAMIITEVFNSDYFIHDSRFGEYIKKIYDGLNKMIEDMKNDEGDSKNRDAHVYAYTAVLKRLEDMVKKVNEWQK